MIKQRLMAGISRYPLLLVLAEMDRADHNEQVAVLAKAMADKVGLLNTPPTG